MKLGLGIYEIKEKYKGVDENYMSMKNVEKGMKVGLFGGQLKKKNGGKEMVEEIDIRRMKIDKIWWMVKKGNKMKERSEMEKI